MAASYGEHDEEPASRRVRASWTSQMVDDMVHIVVSNNYYSKKLLTEVTNASTADVYYDVLESLRQRHPNLTVDITQCRNKFKACVRIVNRAVKTIKTSTGLAREKEEKGYTKWFDYLVPIVSERPSNQHGHNSEPELCEEDVPAPATPSPDVGATTSRLNEQPPASAQPRHRKRSAPDKNRREDHGDDLFRDFLRNQSSLQERLLDTLDRLVAPPPSPAEPVPPGQGNTTENYHYARMSNPLTRPRGQRGATATQNSMEASVEISADCDSSHTSSYNDDFYQGLADIGYTSGELPPVGSVRPLPRLQAVPQVTSSPARTPGTNMVGDVTTENTGETSTLQAQPPTDILIKSEVDGEAWIGTLQLLSSGPGGSLDASSSIENTVSRIEGVSSRINDASSGIEGAASSIPTLVNKQQREENHQPSNKAGRRQADRVQLMDCSISQLLLQLKSANNQRLEEMEQHQRQMALLHRREEEIIAAISSRMGL